MLSHPLHSSFRKQICSCSLKVLCLVSLRVYGGPEPHFALEIKLSHVKASKPVHNLGQY